MQKLTRSQSIFIGSMLFGMLFGAGNLIFPVHMGQLAGSHLWNANWGFIATGVILPFMALLAIGLTGSRNLEDLASNVHPAFARIYTILLYLTIGPAFAQPRTATVSYQVGIAPFIGGESALALGVFSFLFMLIALLFSLKPSRLMSYIGKGLNPIFLLFLALLVGMAVLYPMADTGNIAPQGDYVSHAFFTGFKEGYNTMDVLAMLAFSVVVINTMKDLGVTDKGSIAKEVVKVGIIVVVLMSVIYTLITWLGTSSVGGFAPSANGGIALAQIAHHYFGTVGGLLLAVIVTFACLKTAIGLTTSCADTFTLMFPNSFRYETYCCIFAGASFLIANVGLNQIIVLAVPVLMFLYPIAIALILVSFVRYFLHTTDKRLYRWPVVLASICAFGDALGVVPDVLKNTGVVQGLLSLYAHLPLYALGMSWVVPTVIALCAAALTVKTQKA